MLTKINIIYNNIFMIFTIKIKMKRYKLNDVNNCLPVILVTVSFV